MRRNALIHAVLSTPWALEPGRLSAFVAILERWQEGAPVPPEAAAEIAAARDARDARRSAAVSASGGGIAVLPLYGVLTQRGNMIDAISGPGSTSTDMFGAELRALLADDSIGQILIDVDSPGGSVYGVMELAATIREARAQKPIVAVANSLAASAAYWVASQAGELYMSPGAEVGSIGVYIAHTDRSEALKQQGLSTTIVSAGKYKLEGNPFGPLDDEGRAFLQSRVDEIYGAFTGDVAKGRGVPIAQVRDDMGQGRLLGADAAYKAQMVDGVKTQAEVIDQMKRAAKTAARGARAEDKPAPPRLAHARRQMQIMG